MNRATRFALGVIALMLFASGCGPTSFVVGASPADRQLRATVVHDDGRWFSDRVAIIDISGVILNTRKPGLLGTGDNPVSQLHEKLKHAAEDPRVKAIILRLNTPGGAVTASDAMYRMVRRFREETGKPIVALMMDVAASGGYYVACAADRIVAYPTAVTGSVGVIVQTVSLKPALDRIGVRAEAFTSGSNKEAGSMLGAMSDGHREVLQALVDEFFERFADVVRRSRPGLTDADFALVTDGRVVSGVTATRIGLVDQVGDLESTHEAALRLARIDHADMVLYHTRLEYAGSPFASSPQPPGAPITQINLAQFNLSGWSGAPTNGFFYLWQPSLP